MKNRLILILLVGAAEIFAFLRWSGCWLLQSNFYFTFQSLAMQLLIATNEEKGLPLVLIRVLHNKATGFVWGVSQIMLQYIDMRFLIELLGIVGAIGVYLGFWYFFAKKPKNMYLWAGMILMGLLSFIEMVFIPHIGFSMRIIPLSLVFGVFSLFGVWEFLKNGNTKIRMSVVLFFILLSLCALLLFPHSLYSMCLKI